MAELSLNVKRTINASIESVYKAWLDPEMLAKFMLPVENMSVPKVEVDARVGGRFTIIMQTPDKNDIPHSGEYLSLSPHNQIVFSWESPFSIDGSTVTINLKESGTSTEIDLTHLKFPNEESRSNHEKGWAAILDCLDKIFH